MNQSTRKSFAILEMVLLITMTFALAHMLAAATPSQAIAPPQKSTITQGASLFVKLLASLGSALFKDIVSVSALDVNDLTGGVATCVQSTTGKNCQEYPVSECASQCDGACIPTSRDQVAQCKLGTCYDALEGTCQVSSPKQLCESNQGRWFDDPYGNIKQCKPGCCMINGQPSFTTAQRCAITASRAGATADFKPEVDTLLACIDRATSQEEGACVMEVDAALTCKFTTKTQCTQLAGKFASGYLCSSPDLKTTCQKQASTGCVEGRDEIYWFDSCGNRENIYSANKVESYNDGRILSKANSCSLASGSNLFANQKTCGNCNYIAGSICKTKTATQALSDTSQNVVCRELSCIDEAGKKRQQGESWCAYQGAIGVHDERSSDTPGSRHYRKVCIDGEIRTDPCADYRNEICVQSDTQLQSGSTYSSAACRINLAYTCYEYNKKGDIEQCAKNPDCFVNNVAVSKDFKFDLCVPKYKPGFDLNARGEGAEGICKLATQSCTYIKVKGLGGDKEYNKECLTPKFAEEMNNLCMSLADCGAQANYMGTVSQSYKLTQKGKPSKSGLVTASYIAGLKLLADESRFKNQKPADPGAEYFAQSGIPGVLATPQDPTEAFRSQASLIAGVVGVVLPILASTISGATLLSSVGLAGAYGSAPFASASAAGLTAAGGAVAGAAIGFALTSFLLDATGVGRGLPAAVTYSLMAAGAAGGALAGYAVAGSYLATGSVALGALGLIGLAILVVVLIVIAILSALGIGDVAKIKVTYTCQPWQAPTGGASCAKCGTDGFPCSKYACQSLGQTCQFINEEEKGVGECVDVSPGDVSAPTLRPMSEILPKSYRLQNEEFGVAIKSSESDGCIRETNAFIPFGIETSEVAQCRMEYNHTASFDEMGLDLGTSRFTKNHTLPLIVPSLESLGLDGFDPRARIDSNIYIRCQDKSGNVNEKEYAVSFCIKQGPDITPPVVVDRDPYIETIKSTTITLNASIFTNEPADCRYDSSDTAYTQMKSTMSCANEFDQREILGWRCTATMPVDATQQTYYVRCLDQPWLNGTTSNTTSTRNAATQSYQFKIKKSATPLVIDSVTPINASLVVATQPASVEVVVHTVGGYDGTARCTYTIGNGTAIDFLTGSWTQTHTQVFNTLLSGSYTLPIKCTDIIGNTAEAQASFSIRLDSLAPKATRVYVQNKQLMLITDEPSTCYVTAPTAKKCAFAIENATQMSGAEYTHSILFDESNEYYIKCVDGFNNIPSSCTAVIKKGDLA